MSLKKKAPPTWEQVANRCLSGTPARAGAKGGDAIKAEGGTGDDWYTPLWLWAEIRPRYFAPGQIILDPTPGVRQLPGTVSIPRLDSLTVRWARPWFCNPPFSDIEPFIAHALKQPAPGVFLVPARTDQGWWYKYVPKMLADTIRGRVNYERPDGGKSGCSFPSLILEKGKVVGIGFWDPRGMELHALAAPAQGSLL